MRAMNPSMTEMRPHAVEAAKLLKALAHETRLSILCLLAQGEMTVSQLHQQLDLSQSALSQHLAVLREDGLVRTRRESQHIHYSLAGDKAARIVTLLHDMYCRK